MAGSSLPTAAKFSQDLASALTARRWRSNVALWSAARPRSACNYIHKMTLTRSETYQLALLLGHIASSRSFHDLLLPTCCKEADIFGHLHAGSNITTLVGAAGVFQQATELGVAGAVPRCHAIPSVAFPASLGTGRKHPGNRSTTRGQPSL